jgi:hypothetical protein
MNPFRKFRAKPVQHEQNDCITFATFMQTLAPRYGIVWTHFPAGGKRHIKTAVEMKKMGVRAGVFDYYLRGPNGKTMWIEFKYGKGKLTEEQQAWRYDLEPHGDIFEVVYGPVEALAVMVRHGLLPENSYIPCGPSIRIPWRP